MTRAVGDDDAMVRSLDEVATLFDQAQNSVFKLMASVSTLRASFPENVVNKSLGLGPQVHEGTQVRVCHP